MPTAEEITRHHDPDPAENPWVHGSPARGPVEIVPYNFAWPERYRAVSERVLAALGGAVLDIEHVGSTAVEGLGAKDVIDIDLTVADPCDEQTYVPALENLGFCPDRPGTVFPRAPVPDPREPADEPACVRTGLSREYPAPHVPRLASHPSRGPRALRLAKRSAIPGGGHVIDYNTRKQHVVREIYDRLFRAAGML